MATKRKHEESEQQEAVHAERQAQVYGSNPKPAKKPRRIESTAPKKKQAHASSVNAIKKRIRDVRRRLERADDLPADVRIENERALAAYEQELVAALAEKTRQKMIKKYHMVRFFERQKATRQLKKLRKRLLEAESPEETEALKKQVHVAEVDLNYTQYCPLSEVYVSLYPQKKSSTEEDDGGSNGTSERPKPPMWAEVEKCMEEGTLDQLRNRVPNVRINNTPRKVEKKPPKPKQKDIPSVEGLNRRERRSRLGISKAGKNKNTSVAFEKNKAFGASQGPKGNVARDIGGDDESDGGFFEE